MEACTNCANGRQGLEPVVKTHCAYCAIIMISIHQFSPEVSQQFHIQSSDTDKSLRETYKIHMCAPESSNLHSSPFTPFVNYTPIRISQVNPFFSCVLHSSRVKSAWFDFVHFGGLTMGLQPHII